MGKKAVLIPSTLESKADGIEKVNCFHISIIPWKCGKILPPLCQGAEDQTCFHRVEKKIKYSLPCTANGLGTAGCAVGGHQCRVNQLLLGLGREGFPGGTQNSILTLLKQWEGKV